MSDEQKLRKRSDVLARQERETYAKLCTLRDQLDIVTSQLDRIALRQTRHSMMAAGSLGLVGNLIPFSRRRKDRPL